MRKDEYSKEFIENLFTESDRISLDTIGEVDFPTGQVIIADPLLNSARTLVTLALVGC